MGKHGSYQLHSPYLGYSSRFLPNLNHEAILVLGAHTFVRMVRQMIVMILFVPVVTIVDSLVRFPFFMATLVYPSGQSENSYTLPYSTCDYLT